jgi:hypothetical protein
MDVGNWSEPELHASDCTAAAARNWASGRHHQSRNLDRKLFSQTERLGESARIDTSVYFQYGTTNSYGLTTAPQSHTGNTSLNISSNISSLTASTMYHFRIVTTNSAGTRYGSDRTFTTLPPTGFPIVTTKPATNVAPFAATLNGLLDPHGLTTSVYFQYGTTTSYGHRTPMQSQTGNTYRNIAANINGLSRNTTYHFRIVATNSVGTRYGTDRTFIQRGVEP